MRAAAIVGWTGRGSFDDLVRTAERVASVGGAKVKTRSVGADVIFPKVDPLRVVRALKNLPGARWVAVGYEFTGMKEFEDRLEALASRYLRGNSTFSVSSNVKSPDYSGGDIVLMATSKILSNHRGSKVVEGRTALRFHVTINDERGAVGVIIADGAGGVPTSANRSAYCLVSGGMHSSVAAWMAARGGFSPRLVHFWEGDGPLRAVAKLYSEISHRMDARYLSLELVRGEGKVANLLGAWLVRTEKIPIILGHHLECKDSRHSEDLVRAPPRMVFPVMLLGEEEIAQIQAGLGLTGTAARDTPLLFQEAKASLKWERHLYGGTRADMNTVLDSLSS